MTANEAFRAARAQLPPALANEVLVVVCGKNLVAAPRRAPQRAICRVRIPFYGVPRKGGKRPLSDALIAEIALLA